MITNSKTLDLLRHLATRPGHDEVKADFRELLIEEFGADRSARNLSRPLAFSAGGGWANVLVGNPPRSDSQ